MKILKAIDRRDLIGNYRNMERRYEPLTPAQRKARVEAYRKQFLELTAEPPPPPEPPRELNRWYYASDGRKWFGSRAAAASLGASMSQVRESVRKGWRCRGVWLALSAERAARAERWGMRRKTRPVFASDGRDWPTLIEASKALGASESSVRWCLCVGYRVKGVWLGESRESAGIAAMAGLVRNAVHVHASDGRRWSSIREAAEELGVTRRMVEVRRSGRFGGSVAGVWLGRTLDEARARAGAGKERAGR